MQRKKKYHDWLSHIAWLVRYDRQYSPKWSRMREITVILKSFLNHWKYKPKDRWQLFDVSRLALWTKKQ